MSKAMVVKGTLRDPTHIELDEPVQGDPAKVEVVLKSAMKAPKNKKEDVFAFIARMPAGKRTKEEIDQQIKEERDSWER